MVRDIAGGHLIDNGNKRTAVEVVEKLIKKTAGGAAKTNCLECFDKVATGKLRKV